MIRKDIVRNALIGKFANECLHGIVDDVFIRALPFDFNNNRKSEILLESLTEYSKAVYESFGGLDMLTENLKKNPDNYLLRTLTSVCMKAATEAADDVLELADLDDGDAKVIVDEAKMPEDVYDDFVENAKQRLNIEKISEIIKDKTISTIKDEKQAIKDEEKLEEEIKEMTTDEDELEDGDIGDVPPPSDESSEHDDENSKSTEVPTEDAVESYLSFVIPKTLPHHHVSLFSKLLDVSLEAAIISGTKEELPVGTLRNVTLNHTFSELKGSKHNTLSVLESDVTASADQLAKLESEEEAEESKDMNQKRDASLAMAIAMYTLFETFYTLNLKNFDINLLRAYVESANDFGDDAASSKESLAKVILGYADDYRKYINNCTIIEDLKNIRRVIAYLTNTLSKVTDTNLKTVYSNLLNLIDEKCNSLSDSEPEMKDPTPYDIHDKETTVTNIGKVLKLLRNRHDITEIRFIIDDKDEDTDNLDAEFVSKNGTRVGNTVVPIKYKKAFGSYTGYVAESTMGSKLFGCGKTLVIVNPRTGDRKVIR